MKLRAGLSALVFSLVFILPGLAVTRETVTAREIHFALNSDHLSREAESVLDSVAAALAAQPAATATLVGHTCDLSGDAHNERLAARRVAAAQRYLLKKGVAAERLVTDSRGETSPKYDNSDPKQKALNRRVEILITLREELPAPTVTLTADPALIRAGQPATLSWSSANATTVSISDLGDVAPSGSRTVMPAATTTYLATALGEGGEATAAATVQVAPPPGITLTANPEVIVRGQSSLLIWSSSEAATVTIDPAPGEVAASGVEEVSPDATTRYVATAFGAGGEATASVTLQVIAPRPTITLTADPLRVELGHTAMLNWTSTDAETVSIAPEVGPVELCGSRMVLPGEATTYVATALGEGGEATASVSIAVTPPPPKPVLRTAYAKVMDAGGRFVTDLSADRFRVVEDGQAREIVSVAFEPSQEPASIALALDRSSSMGNAVRSLKQAAIAFVDEKKPVDRILTLTFSSTVETLHDFDQDAGAIAAAISRLGAFGNTRLYDALYTAAERLGEEPQPRFIVLMTDGVDEGGWGARASAHSLDEALAKARDNQVTVYTIGLGDQIDRAVLTRITRETRGYAFYTANPEDLRRLYRDLSIGLLRGRYRIVYRSTADASGAPSISVNVGSTR